MMRAALLVSVALSSAAFGYAAGAGRALPAAPAPTARATPETSDTHAALRAGAYWAGLSPAAKQVYLTGFLAGAAAEQVRAAAESAGRGGDSLAVSSRAIDELRVARKLQYRFAPPVYSAQVDDFYWWQNHTETPIVDALIFFNREMLKQQQGHGSP